MIKLTTLLMIILAMNSYSKGSKIPISMELEIIDKLEYFNDLELSSKIIKNKNCYSVILDNSISQTSLLQYSIKNDNFNTFKFLIKNNCNIKYNLWFDIFNLKDSKYILFLRKNKIMFPIFYERKYLLEMYSLKLITNEKMIDFLNSNGYLLLYEDKYIGNNFIMETAALGFYNLLKEIIMKHMISNINITNHKNRNLLIESIKYGGIEILIKNLKKSCNVYKILGDLDNRFLMIKFLIKSNININHIDYKYKTALDYSLSMSLCGNKNELKVISLLKKHGAKRACEILKTKCKNIKGDK